MAKFATAYVEVKADLSNFGTGLAKEIETRLGDADVNNAVDRNFRPKFSGVGKSLADAIKNQTGPELEQAATRAVQALDNIPKRSVSQVDLDIRRAQAEAATIRADLADLARESPTIEVKADITNAKLHLDEIQARVLRLKAERAEITIDVDRSKLDALSSVGSSVGEALHGIAISVGGLLGVGGALTGLGQAAAAALPLVALLGVAIGVLVASFGAAVAGAGALGIALAGALGPAAIVALVALAKIAQIVKAIHSDSQGSAAATQAVASAQDQLAAATQGVTSAQENLKQQTLAGMRAMQDAAEAVKDDLLSVQEAQLGIADSKLSLQEATLALKEFKAQAPGLQGIFKKFSDVNVDFSGLKGALDAARKAGGNKLSQDDELKLERLILNVRRAKLGEKAATDRLHDSNVQLSRDRQTEANYLRDGIRAYPGYTSAVEGLATANRSLASAQRASAAAATSSAGELAKLSPIQQKLAATFKIISKAFNVAFGPALNALFGGLNRALQIFVGVLKDPHIVRALRDIGKAMGAVLVDVAKFFSSKGARQSFITLANGAAKLIKIIGSKVFVSFFKILSAIATAALPSLVGLLKDLAKVLDRWAAWIQKHPKQFRKDILALIGTFKGWLGVIIDVGGFLLDLGGKLKSLGDTAGRIFRDLKGEVSDLLGGTDKLSASVDRLNTQHLTPLTRTPQTKTSSGFLGFDARDLKDISAALGRVRTAMSNIIDSLVGPFKTLLGGLGDIVRGFVRIVVSLLTGDFKEAWRGVVDTVRGSLRLVLGVFQLMIAPFKLLTTKLANLLVRAFRTSVGAVRSIIGGLKTAFIDAVNFIIGLVNKIHFKVPGIVPFIGGHKVGVHIDPIDTSKPNLNPGKLPNLTKSPRNLRASASSASDSVQKVINVGGVNISAPAAAVPDAQSSALRFARLVDSLG